MSTSKGLKNESVSLKDLGLEHPLTHWNLSPGALVEKTVQEGMGKITSVGALAVNTGKFTGRSPKDRYIVRDSKTEELVDWGDVNIPISQEHYAGLKKKVLAYLDGCEEIYIRDAFAGANKKYQMKLRVVTEYPWQSLFAYNMFIRPDEDDIKSFEHEWIVYAAPGCKGDPEADGLRQDNFAILNFTEKTIIIGGTAYTGEIKKGIFSALNFILPSERNVLSMHCSANVGKKGDTALFFGLSGTGKTTLSTDPDRKLIGDDEHGWSQTTVFNFEGGCYAKTIDLSKKREPQIYNAIKFGSLVENIGYSDEANRVVNYKDSSITQNTRVSYPIDYIDKIVFNSRGATPENIFFLTCDAFGVLPPISKLDRHQAMYYFLLGYTAKIAGTEEGIVEPQATFSACFGLPFLPLKPTDYANLLGKKLDESKEEINVWLVNTGWAGGSYGMTDRISLPYTRAMITAALNGELNNVEFEKEPYFDLSIPTTCPDVPNRILNPKASWTDKDAYDKKAKQLKQLFDENGEKYLAYLQ